jgi:hypothetical protein
MDADRLVKTYIKIRTARDALKQKYDAEKETLDTQLAAIEGALLDLCKSTGQEGGRTAHGTYTRTVRERYWTNNWPAFYELVLDLKAPQLLEQRINQGNFTTLIKEQPELMPDGVNRDAKYAITVRRPSAS